MQEAMEDEKIQASKVRHSSLEHPRMTRSQLQTKTGFYSMRSTAAGVNRTSSTAYNGRHTAETEPSFVFKSFDVPDGFKRRVNYDRLMKKPAFKPQTQKFDKNALIQERTVTILTKEDKFSKFDMPWISKLRVKDNLEVIKLSKQLTSTIPAPPSFYESDLKKTLKNSPKNNNRLCNFNNVDFDSNGNTNELNHLINPFGKYTPTRTDINFGFGLRKYKSINGFRQDKPWIFPKFKGLKQFAQANNEYQKVKSLITNKESIDDNSSKTPVQGKRQVKSSSKYNDKFPQRNASAIRHLFEKSSQIGSIKWQSGLRFNSDKEY